jgi:hypothetical protein
LKKIRTAVTRGTETTIEAVALGQINAQETFLRSILKNEGKCWTEFYKYVKRRKVNRENIPAIKDGNGRLSTDSIEQANYLNFYYSSSIQL